MGMLCYIVQWGLEMLLLCCIDSTYEDSGVSNERTNDRSIAGGPLVGSVGK